MEDAAWPKRFVYVCNAGGAVNVNVAPMVQAGKGRIGGIVVGEGLSQPNKSDSTDTREATVPTRRILDFGRNYLKLPNDALKVFPGNGDLVGDWLGLLASARALAAERGVEALVFNVSGGRKPMTIGGLLGAGTAAETLSLLTVGVNAFTLREVRFLSDGRLEERPLPAHRHMKLPNYLAMYGIEEVSVTRRLEREARLLVRTEALDLVAKILSMGAAPAAFAPLLRTLSRVRSFPTALAEPDGLTPQAKALLDLLPDASLGNGQLTIDSAEAANFLMGDWLEALCLRAVSEALGDRAGIDVAGKFSVRRIGETAEETEFDLIVYGYDRLSIGECKAVTTVETLREGINRIDNYRTELSGRVGQAWLVAPLMKERRLQETGVLFQAKSRAVDLLSGPEAIGQLVERVRIAHSR